MKQKTISERIRILRSEYNLTAEKFAALVGLSRVAVDNIEKGMSRPHINTMEKIANRLGSTFEWIQNGEGEMLPNGKIQVDPAKRISQEAMAFDPARDTLYIELKRQIDFMEQVILRLTGGKGSFQLALNGTGLKKRSLEPQAA